MAAILLLLLPNGPKVHRKRQKKRLLQVCVCVCVHVLGHGLTHSVGEADGTPLLLLGGAVRWQELKAAGGDVRGAAVGGGQRKRRVDEEPEDSLDSYLDLHGGVELAHRQQQQRLPAHSSSSSSEDGFSGSSSSSRSPVRMRLKLLLLRLNHC